MDPIRVMIVEDSPTVREYLRVAVSTDARLTVVSECQSAEEALANLEGARPDVISMDIDLPRMSGLDATRRIMEVRPTPIVIVSRSVNAADVDLTMNALRAGAVSAMEKPTWDRENSFPANARRICRELVVMSRVKVVRQRFNNSRMQPKTHAPQGLHNAMTGAAPPCCARMVGIVASTGGPRAIETVLTAIGPDFPLPILVVQHIVASFQSGFVAWLDRISPQLVKEAGDGEWPEPGRVYVAPADKHLTIRAGCLKLDSGPPVSGQRPSGTILLRSMAEAFGRRAVGVVLTGMGDDGAEGLLAIHRAGGFTITEDASTAVVNGMPEVARTLGASSVTLPLDSIGTAIKGVFPVQQEVCA
ncbi:MAG TPA: chemotaxis-specific protein-glutamate methyltransferase CheB [Lacipirellulaceae bacterium]|nr:chemotaxis-specific protein-glutamate methyltransferase CheB [Lacipirellulaceae bacterium]